MNVTDFPNETRVVHADNLNRKGTVIGNKLMAKNQVAIEWDDGELGRVNIDNLVTEASLEDEFEIFKDEVNAKLAEAAKLIGEAAAMAATKGKDLQDYDSEAEDALFDHYLIERAMGSAGWNTSSWHC